jgi:hypothetical protein
MEDQEAEDLLKQVLLVVLETHHLYLLHKEVMVQLVLTLHLILVVEVVEAQLKQELKQLTQDLYPHMFKAVVVLAEHLVLQEAQSQELVVGAQVVLILSQVNLVRVAQAEVEMVETLQEFHQG